MVDPVLASRNLGMKIRGRQLQVYRKFRESSEVSDSYSWAASPHTNRIVRKSGCDGRQLQTQNLLSHQEDLFSRALAAFNVAPDTSRTLQVGK